MITLTILLLLLILAYFPPAVIADARRHHNSGAIPVLNIFLGWTFLGCVIALVWACTNVAKPGVMINQAAPV